MSNKRNRNLRKKEIKKRAKMIREENSQRQSWEELENIYQGIIKGIYDIGTQVNEAIRVINLIKDYQTDPNIINTVETISSDISEFSNMLSTIHGKHSSKTGIVRSPEELVECLSIYNEYQIMFERFKSITFNPMLTITEYLTDAQVIIKEVYDEINKKENEEVTVNESN